MRIVVGVFLLFLVAGCRFIMSSNESDPVGLSSVKSKYINANYQVYDVPKKDILAKFILDTLTNREKYDEIYALNIAEQIIDISTKLGIDPVLYASLLGHESWFQTGECYRGGCGISQLTLIGIKEVNHQFLGLHRRHSPAVKEYIDKLFEKYSDLKKDFIYVDTTLPIAATEPSRKIRRGQLVQNPVTSLIYGGILLKIYLAESMRKGRFAVSLINRENKAHMMKIYRMATTRYNGNVNNPRIMNCYAAKLSINAARLLVRSATPDTQNLETMQNSSCRKNISIRSIDREGVSIDLPTQEDDPEVPSSPGTGDEETQERELVILSPSGKKVRIIDIERLKEIYENPPPIEDINEDGDEECEEAMVCVADGEEEITLTPGEEAETDQEVSHLGEADIKGTKKTNLCNIAVCFRTSESNFKLFDEPESTKQCQRISNGPKIELSTLEEFRIIGFDSTSGWYQIAPRKFIVSECRSFWVNGADFSE